MKLIQTILLFCFLSITSFGQKLPPYCDDWYKLFGIITIESYSVSISTDNLDTITTLNSKFEFKQDRNQLQLTYYDTNGKKLKNRRYFVFDSCNKAIEINKQGDTLHPAKPCNKLPNSVYRFSGCTYKNDENGRLISVNTDTTKFSNGLFNHSSEIFQYDSTGLLIKSSGIIYYATDTIPIIVEHDYKYDTFNRILTCKGNVKRKGSTTYGKIWYEYFEDKCKLYTIEQIVEHNP